MTNAAPQKGPGFAAHVIGGGQVVIGMVTQKRRRRRVVRIAPVTGCHPERGVDKEHGSVSGLSVEDIIDRGRGEVVCADSRALGR